MSKIDSKGALRYDLKASLRSIGIFLLVMVLVWLLNFVLAAIFSGSGAYSNGFEMAAAIYVLVAGILSVREDLRFFLQNGRGRPTVFLAQLVIALFTAAVLAVAGSLLMVIFGFATRLLDPQLAFSSLYGLLIGSADGGGIGSVVQMMGYIFLVCLPAFFFGMTVSLIYYRLSKLGKVVFSFAVPAVLLVGLPFLIGSNPAIANAFIAFFQHIYETLRTPMALLAAFSLVASPILALGSWLLLRRAPIK